MKNATLIYNPVAGRKPARRQREIAAVVEALRSSGIAARIAKTTGPGSATELARAAVDGGEELVIACGGDGTINEVINGMCPGSATLAILPGGTANITANELRLPRDPVRAARQLSTWHPRRIALGLASDFQSSGTAHASRYFLSVAGIGFDAYVIHKLAVGFKMSLGVAAYVLEGLRQVRRYSFPPLLCKTDGRSLGATFALIQRTSLYAGWFRTAPNQSITNSHFGLSLYPSRRRARYLLYAFAIMTQRRLRDVSQMESRQVELAPETPGADIYFELDGELAGKLPAKFEVAPGALTLLMPPVPGDK
ncbi:MAG: diacylglycerol/lipid kinase family protein [Terriglobia bacterium]